MINKAPANDNAKNGKDNFSETCKADIWNGRNAAFLARSCIPDRFRKLENMVIQVRYARTN